MIKQRSEQKLPLSQEMKREAWGDGKWVDEPDLEEFEYEGFKCIIERIYMWDKEKLVGEFGGHLCGYVQMPKDHPLFSVEENSLDLEVHGGITFDKKLENGERWIGFDCAHLWDTIPSNEISKCRLPVMEGWQPSTYKNFSYVRSEIEGLVKQLKEIES